jgi:probable HAF family extracellular repeat protein
LAGATVGVARSASAAPIILEISAPQGPTVANGISADGTVVAVPFPSGVTAPAGTTLKQGVAVSGDGGTTVYSAPLISASYPSIAIRKYGDGPGGLTMYYPSERGGSAEALGVNFDGSVAVGRALYPGSFNPTPPFGTYAVRYTGNDGSGQMTLLGDLPGGIIEGGAFDVSGDGTIAVGYSFSALGREAFRHTDALGMVPLDDLSGGIFASQANAISRNGTYIVGYGNSASGQEAFRIVGAGSMAGLGDLPGGTFSSEAKDVSDDGKVVVGTGTTAAGPEAFLWTESGGMARLWDVLLSAGVNPASNGWASLNVATGVTADALTVVGNGTLTDGTQRGFIATIPEPTGVGLLACAGAALLGRRRRRRTGV